MEKILAYVVTVLVGVMIWYLKYQTKRQAQREDKNDEERTERQTKRDSEQKEERDYYRTLITNEQKENVDLNIQGIALQKEMMKGAKDHDDHSRKAWNKTNKSLTAICDRINGNNLEKKVKTNGRK